MHPPKRRKSRISEEKALEILGKKVSEKLEDGDVKGAIRLASSEDKLAANSDVLYLFSVYIVTNLSLASYIFCLTFL